LLPLVQSATRKNAESTTRKGAKSTTKNRPKGLQTRELNAGKLAVERPSRKGCGSGLGKRATF